MNLRFRLLIAVLSLALTLPAATAQQPGSSNPPSGSLATNSATETQEAAPERPTTDAVPDTRPLSGVEEIGVGLRHRARNYVLPSLELFAYGDTNRQISSSGRLGTELAGSIVGRLALQHVTRKSQLTLDYAGGGLLYARDSDLNATMHQIGITQSFTGRRWGLLLGDRASYLPESPFGFGGFGSLGGLVSGIGSSFGMNLGNLNPLLSSDQTILSGRGYRVNNTTIAQLQYSPSARSAITATASYGLLRFEEAGLIDSDHRVFMGGYSRTVTRRDSVALTYGMSMFHFRGSSVGFDNHFIQLGYGHRITGRLAFTVAAGPQLEIFKDSLSGSTRHYYWNAHTALRYRWSRADMGLSYGRYTTTGSGLLIGAQTDLLNLSTSWRFSRNWSGSFSPGYAHNRNLRATTVGSASASYNSYYAGFGVHRELGRYADVFANYTLQGQEATTTNPLGNTASSTLTRHTFGLGLNWHGRQVPVD